MFIYHTTYKFLYNISAFQTLELNTYTHTNLLSKVSFCIENLFLTKNKEKVFNYIAQRKGTNKRNDDDVTLSLTVFNHISILQIWPLSDFGFLRDSPNGHRFSDD